MHLFEAALATLEPQRLLTLTANAACMHGSSMHGHVSFRWLFEAHHMDRIPREVSVAVATTDSCLVYSHRSLRSMALG